MFILTESLMNGTVTVKTRSYIINAPTFDEAVQYIRDLAKKTGAEIVNDRIYDDGFHYGVKQGEVVAGEISLGCQGFLARGEAKTL